MVLRVSSVCDAFVPGSDLTPLVLDLSLSIAIWASSEIHVHNDREFDWPILLSNKVPNHSEQLHKLNLRD